MSESTNMNTETEAVEKEIKGYLNAIARGFKEGGIRQNIKPQHIQTVCKHVALSNAVEFADFITDLMGETAGLAAGTSSMSKEAMQSVNAAQSMWFCQLRERVNAQSSPPLSEDDLVGCQKMLHLHKESLVKWIQTGNTYFDVDGGGKEVDSELSEFSSLLTTASLRLGVMAAFLGALEASYQGLMIFQN